MLSHLGLRLRILLFFSFLTASGIAITILSLYVGYQRSGQPPDTSGYVFAAITSGFGLLALNAAIWLLFDENVAKPIERLAAGLRTHTHAGSDAALNPQDARYLGDLAPAALEVSSHLQSSALSAAQAVAQETAHLQQEKDRLTALLSEIPVATILINSAHQISLYDGQAAEVLSQIAPPRLNASIFDYFERTQLETALISQKTAAEAPLALIGTRGNFSYSARLRPLGSDGHLLIIDAATSRLPPSAARPVTFDFGLLENTPLQNVHDHALIKLNFTVLDTETTGLLPHKDAIVQIGAIRVVNGRLIAPETLDLLVNPQRSIPTTSTKVHGITDDMVATAPKLDQAAQTLHDFARDSVIVAHNAPFDMAFLHRHGKTTGLQWTHPILDTVLLSAVVYGTNEVHTLDALCARLGISIPENLRHTALGDAHATAQALCKLLPILMSQGHTTLADVITQTRKHARLIEDLN